VIAALTAFAGLPRDPGRHPLGCQGVDWLAKGMDFADALHLGRAEGCEAFVSFDQQFAAVANPISKVKVRAP
jgi:predicted nucleic-acid-binding protein